MEKGAWSRISKRKHFFRFCTFWGCASKLGTSPTKLIGFPSCNFCVQEAKCRAFFSHPTKINVAGIALPNVTASGLPWVRSCERNILLIGWHVERVCHHPLLFTVGTDPHCVWIMIIFSLDVIKVGIRNSYQGFGPNDFELILKVLLVRPTVQFFLGGLSLKTWPPFPLKRSTVSCWLRDHFDWGFASKSRLLTSSQWRSSPLKARKRRKVPFQRIISYHFYWWF